MLPNNPHIAATPTVPTQLTGAQKFSEKYPNALIIPEGGSNDMAVEGVRYMLGEDTKDFADKAWESTKDTANDAWEKTKDAAEDVKAEVRKATN